MSLFRCFRLLGSQEKFQHVCAISKLASSNYSTESSKSFLEKVKKKLTSSLQPEFLEVINESEGHNVPKGSASHIRVIIVSPLFNDKRLVQRHRLVNDVLQEELKGPIHALSIQAVSTSEMKEVEVEKEESPPCRGGFKR